MRLDTEDEEALEPEEGKELKGTAATVRGRRGSLLEPVGKPLDEVATAEMAAEDDRDLVRGLGSVARVADLVLHMGRRTSKAAAQIAGDCDLGIWEGRLYIYISKFRCYLAR